MAEHYDVGMLGGGQAGEAVVRRLAGRGLRVALAVDEEAF
jgi:glycerol-3-phosphate dehydrogenase